MKKEELLNKLVDLLAEKNNIIDLDAYRKGASDMFSELEQNVLKIFDTNPKLNHNSWIFGGTHITNFSPKYLYSYVNAIEQYKEIEPETELIISSFAYNSSGELTSDYSLHKIGKGSDLSVFWEIKRNIK